jgi:hypothetical protein
MTDRYGLVAYRDLILAVRYRVAQLISEGKTAEQVVAAKPTMDWDAKVTGSTPQVADRFVG